MVENHFYPACMFSYLTTFFIICEVLIAVTLCKAILGPKLNLLALVNEVIAEKAKQLLIEDPLLPYLYVELFESIMYM